MNNDTQQGKKQLLFSTLGIVKDTNDPAQQGRVRVYCPSVDHEDYTVDDLPWALYVTPFGGSLKNNKSGVNEDISYGPVSYGMWAIPKVGATVVIQFLNGDPNYRVYVGCVYPIQSNRGMPAGRGYDITQSKPYPKGPFTDSYEEIQPSVANQKEAGLADEYYFTRGGYERQVAQAVTDKDGTEGYAKNPNKTDPKDLDPQGYCFTTPGQHFISMNDSSDFCRVRIKTTAGHQVIMDDTNERIYVSTAKGNNWFEMDQDGHVHFYGAQSISFTTDADFNITAIKNINMKAGGDVNIKAGNVINATADTSININAGCSTLITCGDHFEVNATSNVNITSGKKTDVKAGAAMSMSTSAALGLKSGAAASLTSGAALNLKAGGNILATGSKIHLNGPGAASAADAAEAAKANLAVEPGIVPIHEPFYRPQTQGQRNPKWQG